MHKVWRFWRCSDKYDYHLDLEAVARIWRGGCIIRAALLEDIRAAFQLNSNLSNLLLDPNLSQKIMECIKKIYVKYYVKQAS